MKKQKHFLSIVFCLSLCGMALPASAEGGMVPALQSGRQQTVKGRVLDSNGEPVIGANVRVKDTKTATVTDVDGNFTLAVPAGSRLVVSYLGYKEQEVTVRGGEAVITLQESDQALDEVVVTALGIRKEAKSLSYNVQQLKGSDVMDVQDVNFVNNLAGKVAGVTINTSAAGAGGSTRVVMRGEKSINGTNNVLYVVDGIPMPSLSSTQPTGIFEGAGQTGDAASNINPDDIESISVLTGPSAAALYGAMASNGVILITTKKGEKGRLDVTYNGSFQFSHPFVMPDFQNTYGPTESGSYFSWGQKLATPSSYDPEDFFQTGTGFTNSVSLSTGSDRNQTYVSMAATDNDGIIHNNKYNRYNFTVRNTTNFLDNKLQLDLSYMLTYVKEQNMTAQGQYHNPLVPVYLFPAGDDFSKLGYFERYSSDRNFPTQYWPYSYDMSMENPYWETERELFQNHKVRNMATMSLKWNIADWISLTGRVKYDKSVNRYEEKFYASTNTLYASEQGHYGLRHVEDRQLFAEAFVSINKYFADDQWNITSNIGTSFNQFDAEVDGWKGNLFNTPNFFDFSNVVTTDNTFKPEQSGQKYRMESVYGTAQLGYRSMGYLDVTAREDWSSKLEKSYFYWSAGLSGIFTEIFPQIKTDRWLNYLKARVSYSEVGNDPLNPFLVRTQYAVNHATGYPETTGVLYTDLDPERTKSWEAGIDFVLFHNKLRVNATLYSSRTYNQFFNPSISASTGYSSIWLNGGRVDNKGVELTARFNQPLGPIQWNTYLTWTLNRNKVKRLLHNAVNPIDGSTISQESLDMGGTSGYKMMLTEGGTMSDIYVTTLKTDEHGAIYIDPRSQTVEKEANNYVYAGHASPNYNLSWGNDFSWKGLHLGFLFTYRNGGVAVSETQAIMDYYGASQASADARDAGGVKVNGRPIPAMDFYQTVGSPNGTVDSYYVYSATNLRLSELSFGYDVPVNRWVKWVKGVNVSFVAHNLWMLYNKAPFDPEMTSNTGTYFQGIDYFMQPSLRTMGFSVKVRF